MPRCTDDLTWFCVEMSSGANFLNIAERCCFSSYERCACSKICVRALLRSFEPA